MKMLIPFLLGLVVCLVAATPGRGQTTWKLVGSETVPAAEGVSHQVQTLTGSGTLLPVGATPSTTRPTWAATAWEK